MFLKIKIFRNRCENSIRSIEQSNKSILNKRNSDFAKKTDWANLKSNEGRWDLDN